MSTLKDRAKAAYEALPPDPKTGKRPSYASLEKQFGVPPTTLSRMLAGSRANFELDTLATVAAALGVTTDYLISDAAEPIPDDRARWRLMEFVEVLKEAKAPSEAIAFFIRTMPDGSDRSFASLKEAWERSEEERGQLDEVRRVLVTSRPPGIPTREPAQPATASRRRGGLRRARRSIAISRCAEA